jgi:transcription elongation factor Elf1
MKPEAEYIEEELDLDEFNCPYCGSQQGHWIEVTKTESGITNRDYWCEICDAPPGQSARDERDYYYEDR